ncbi:hypothetical protein IMCC20628_04685 (plasmid) [Hoeflea sp. IMCC20628]|nr:hypothetical protein IMCC20628_04685 [Hoeflea sp. IMCC20628]
MNQYSCQYSDQPSSRCPVHQLLLLRGRKNVRFAVELWLNLGDEASLSGAALVGIAVSDAVVEFGTFDGAKRHCQVVCLSSRGQLPLVIRNADVQEPGNAAGSNSLQLFVGSTLANRTTGKGCLVLQPRRDKSTEAQRRRCRDGEQNIDMNIDSCFMWKFGIQMLVPIYRHGLALHLRT